MNTINIRDLVNNLNSIPIEYRDTIVLVINGEYYDIDFNEKE